MGYEMMDRGAVDNRDAGFRAFKCERAEPGPFPPAHDTYLHTSVFVLNCFKYTVIPTYEWFEEATDMGADTYRELPAERGSVQCLPDKREPVDHCRLCIHCREFKVRGKFVKSPSLAYCVKCRVTDDVDLSAVEAVKCADRQGEGFHNIASIIG
jgi:hypothetical protein